MARSFPWLKVVHHAQNRGYGGALRTGFETASKDLVFYTDGDAQYDPRELALLYQAFTPGVDFVNGIKIGAPGSRCTARSSAACTTPS